MKHYILILSLFISILDCCGQGDFRDSNLPIDERVELLMDQLTLDEKIGFLQHNNPAIERLGIPAYSWWNEALHGVARNGFATVYPMPIALAATFDDKSVEEMFSLVADEARIKYFESQKKSQFGDNTGLTFFAPNINIFRDPRWGRGMETYGEDPYLTAMMGTACINGLQQKFDNKYKSLACIKHFAVHSGPEATRHSFNAIVSERDLWTTYLPAFKRIVKNTDVSMVMCGYNRLNGEPCCTNDALLVDILKNQWGYRGLFVTDCWALNDCWERDTVILRHKTHETAAHAAADAFGSVIDLECGSGLNALRDAVNQNLISENVINTHTYKILKARFLLGMFDSEQPTPKATNTSFFDDKALELARKSIVLLKNNGILPIKINEYKNIAIIGPNAADSVMLSGNYNGTPRNTITILEGITQHINSLPKQNRPNIFFDTACYHVGKEYKISKDFYKKIAKCDLVIFVGGLSPELEGEQLEVEAEGFLGGDRTSIELPDIQRSILMKLKSLDKPVIFVLCSGGAVALDWENNNTDAILEAWYGGQAAGTAVADVLFGKVNPSGKLPITFYSSKNKLPDFESYDMTNRTYRYLTERPLFPFGFGLSYTNFDYFDGKFDPKSRTLKFKVKNSGKYAGDEVVQVYITNKNDVNGPYKTLVGFKRIHLLIGETRNMIFKIDDEFFEVFDESLHQFKKISGGEFTIEFGYNKIDIKI